MEKWDMKWIWGAVALLVLVVAAFRFWPVGIELPDPCDRAEISRCLREMDDCELTEPEGVAKIVSAVKALEFGTSFRRFHEAPDQLACEVYLSEGDSRELYLMCLSNGGANGGYDFYARHAGGFWIKAKNPEVLSAVLEELAGLPKKGEFLK